MKFWRCTGHSSLATTQRYIEVTPDQERERVREILAKHQPRVLDTAVDKDLHDYLRMVQQRSTADYEAAEWEQ